MRTGIIIIMIGIVMFVLGMIAFYSIHGHVNSDLLLRSIKYGGTFFGIMGIGVTIAGFLLYIINRPQIQSH